MNMKVNIAGVELKNPVMTRLRAPSAPERSTANWWI